MQRKRVLEDIWPIETAPSIAGLGAAPGFRPARSPAEARSDETTRVAREFVESQTDERRAQVARLRQARLDKEAAEKAQAAAVAPKKRRKPQA